MAHQSIATRVPAACLVLAFALSTPYGIDATAQGADAASPDASNELEEITVTARYRTENLQETPIAITAINGEEAEARGFNNVVEITKSAPNVTLQQSGSNGCIAAAAFIRGVGQSDFTLSFEP